MSEEAEEIFTDALEVEASEREAFLSEACHGDKELRAEVEGLLRDADGANTFFDSLTRGAPGAPRGGGLPVDKAGTQIGPYRLIRLLGRGGFGSVWLAGQTQPIRRHVALKLLNRGMDSEEVLARFRAEQQALALMDHPNIARVYEAGVAPDGRPFFAMEMVEGEKITEYCVGRKLSIPERLHLFLQVCAAINHAHQKGIIHRDIKPSNVLVIPGDDQSAVKVIDFGIAKAIEGDLADRTLLTLQGRPVGTPAYMSPEQAGLAGQDIDTRSDIYGLGALLYELLAGTPPFDSRTLLAAGYDEMRRIIREVEPLRPSAKLTSLKAGQTATHPSQPADADVERPQRSIPSDLDWIVMKAMEKSRDRRYGTADALSQDINRFIADEPVSAKPPTTFYLIRKFARRNRTSLLVAAGFLLLLVVATVVSTWQAVRAIRAEALAEKQRADAVEERNAKELALQDAEAVSNFLAEVFRRPDPDVDGRKVTVAQALDKAGEKLNAELSGQPVRLALLQETLAKTYAGLGLYPKSLELRRKVLESRRSALGTDNPATLAAMHELVSMLVVLGYYQEARDLGEQEVAIRSRAGKADDEASFEAMESLAENYFRSGDREKAITTQKDLRQRLMATYGPSDPRAVKAARVLANYYRQIGDEKSAGEIERGTEPKKEGGERSAPVTDSEHHTKVNERLEAMQNHLADLREKTGPQSPETLAYMRELAGAYYGSNHRGEAIRMQEELVALLRDKLGEEHPETTAAEDTLAFYYWRHNRMGEAGELKKRLIERRTRIFGPEHAETLTSRAELAGWLQIGVGKTGEAQAVLEECVPLMRKVLGSSDRRTLDAISNLARCYTNSGKTREAVGLLAECAPQMPDDTFVNGLLAELQLWMGLDGDYNKTRRWMIDYAVARRGTMRSRPDILERAVLIACLAPLENPEQGRELLATIGRCAEIRAASGRPKIFEPGQAWRHLVVGLLHYRTGDYEKAEVAFSQSLRSMEEGNQRENAPEDRARVNFYRAMSMLKHGKADEGRQLCDDANKMLTPPPSAEQPLFRNQGPPKYLLAAWLAQREATALYQQQVSGRQIPSMAGGQE